MPLPLPDLIKIKTKTLTTKAMLKNKFNDYTRAVLLCVIMLMIGLAPVFAQNDRNQQQQQQQAEPQQMEEQPVMEAPETETAPATTSSEYSDQDVMQFVMVAGEMSTIVQDSEKEMIQVIQGENLDVEKFNEIMEARQSPETDKINATAEEITAFNNAAMKVIEIQNSMREEMQKVIARQGMDATKFQEMMMAYQQDPAFQQKVNQLLGE
jgi:hypothetical protein